MVLTTRRRVASTNQACPSTFVLTPRPPSLPYPHSLPYPPPPPPFRLPPSPLVVRVRDVGVFPFVFRLVTRVANIVINHGARVVRLTWQPHQSKRSKNPAWKTLGADSNHRGNDVAVAVAKVAVAGVAGARRNKNSRSDRRQQHVREHQYFGVGAYR